MPDPVPYCRTPCNDCPWRKDVKPGQFKAERFRALAHTAYDASFKLFACHKSGDDRPTTCAGFLMQNSLHNVAARAHRLAGGADCWSPVPLFASYREMAIANGVAADDPVLDPCRGDDDPAPRRRR